jgi:exportin-7
MVKTKSERIEPALLPCSSLFHPGNRSLSLDVPKEQIYPMRLKGISVCFLMLKAILCGNYVNFGVFKLYGDDALDNVLNCTAKLILSIPQNNLLEYPKLSQAYYILVENLAQDHITYLSTLEPNVFLYIVESISEGLKALGRFCGPSREFLN